MPDEVDTGLVMVAASAERYSHNVALVALVRSHCFEVKTAEVLAESNSACLLLVMVG